VQDVRETGGVWHLNITPHELRGLKTATSRRAVPLHPEVLRLGFVAYVRNTPVSGRAFPDLLPGTHGNLTGAFSKYWARFSDECGITDRRTAFHSFRHGFKDACRGASISEEIHDALTGHRTVSVGRSYGLGVPLSALAEAVRRISYPGVVLRN
jgi:integrase